jgi:hypothetical protein
MYMCAAVCVDAIYAKIDPTSPVDFSQIQQIHGLYIQDPQSDFGLKLPYEMFKLSWPAHCQLRTSL